MSYAGKNPKFRSVVFPDEGSTSLSNAPTGGHRLINRNGKLWLKDSSGNESQLGASGTGGKNYLTNPSAAADTTGLVASGSGVTVARTTTASELPRAQTTGTGFKITGVSGTDYARWRFTIDEADKGRVLAVLFALRTLSGYANGDFKVEVYSNTASDYSGSYTELGLSTDVSGTSAINAGTTSFGATFVATTADYYEVRIVRVAGTAAIGVSDVKVTPDQAAQGAALEAWESFTPTGTWTTNTTYTGFKRRVGDTLEMEVQVALSGAPNATAFYLNMPSGLTIDTSKRTTTLADQDYLGDLTILDSGTNYHYAKGVYGTTTAIRWLILNASATNLSGTTNIGATDPMTWASGDRMWIRVRVPVAEWAQSGNVNIIKQDNLNNWQSYTPTGSWVANTTYTGRWRRVGDSAEFEIQVATSGAPTSGDLTVSFLPTGLTVDTSKVPGSFGNEFALGASAILDVSTGTRYPGTVTPAASTAVRVVHAVPGTNLGIVAHSAPMTFASGDYVQLNFKVPIAEWANQNNTSLCGFLEYQPGTAAGILNANGVKAFADATAPTTGYVGERQANAGSSSSAGIVNLASVTLGAGDWEITAVVYGNSSASSATNYVDFAVSTANNNLTPAISQNGISTGVSSGWFPVTAANRGMGTVVMQKQLSSSQTYYLNAQYGSTTTMSGHLYARRVR